MAAAEDKGVPLFAADEDEHADGYRKDQGVNGIFRYLINGVGSDMLQKPQTHSGTSRLKNREITAV